VLLRFELLDGPARGQLRSVASNDVMALDLGDGCRAVTLLPARALLLTCERGHLWVTLKHDTRDYLLEPGTSMVARTDSLPIVHATPGGRLLVSAIC